MVRQLGNRLLACYTLTIDQYCVLLLLWMLLYNVWVCIASIAGLVAGLVLTILSTFIGRGKGGHAPRLICKNSPREVLVTVFNALV